VTGALLYGYLGGWVLTSFVVALLAWRLQDEAAPAAHPRLLSIVAGAAWPVLIVALAEAGAVALTTEIMHSDEPALGVVG
jgi:hypothetical protein